MNHWGDNSDLPQKRRFPASSFEFRLFLLNSSFRFAHPPLAYMRARACIRISGGRKYMHAVKRSGWIHVDAIRIPAQCAYWWT